MFIIVLVLSFWLMFTDTVGTAPEELQQAWRVDILHASRSELMILPGIGPALADRIVEYRASNPLSTPEDLARIHGIGPATVEDVRRLVVFEEDEQ